MFTGCLKDDDLKLKSVEYIPAQLNDGWEIEPFNSENFNMDILNSLLAEIYSEYNYPMIRSLVVIKNVKNSCRVISTRFIRQRNAPSVVVDYKEFYFYSYRYSY